MPRSAAFDIGSILDAIANIEADIAGHDIESFRADRRTRQLVERNLEIISEASRGLPESLKADAATIPWRDIGALGNILRHAYHRTEPAILWDTCTRDLGVLKAAVARMSDTLASQRGGRDGT